MSPPQREAFFALKFLRALAERAVASEIGPDACLLLTIVVTEEDRQRYHGPVSFWNGHLIRVTGCSEDRLARARQRAIDAGWLEYERGRKSTPGRYRVTIPGEQAPVATDPQEETNAPPTVFPLELRGQPRDTPVLVPEHSPRVSPPESREKTVFSPACPPSFPRKTQDHSSLSLHPKTKSPIPTLPEPTSERAVIEAVAGCGLVDAERAVRVALARGLTIPAILAIVHHFRSRPGSWGPGALHSRLTQLGLPESRPEEAWPPEHPASQRIQTSRHPSIDHFSHSELRRIVPPELHQRFDQFSREHSRKSPLDDPVLRAAVLAAFERSQQSAGPLAMTR